MMTEALNRNLSRQKAVAREVFDVQEAVLVYIAQRR
jgi:BMFP domain-containing protein YqiC